MEKFPPSLILERLQHFAFPREVLSFGPAKIAIHRSAPRHGLHAIHFDTGMEDLRMTVSSFLADPICPAPEPLRITWQR